jgi:hypothetical protein
MDIKITKEEKCISLLCSFLDSWDSRVMDIESNRRHGCISIFKRNEKEEHGRIDHRRFSGERSIG